MALTMFSPPSRPVGAFRSALVTAAVSINGAGTVIVLLGEVDIRAVGSHRTPESATP